MHSPSLPYFRVGDKEVERQHTELCSGLPAGASALHRLLSVCLLCLFYQAKADDAGSFGESDGPALLIILLPGAGSVGRLS